MARPIPRNEESVFEFHELFFSQTDKHGVIRAGNDVFIRVSEYSTAEMIGQPHNIIRHPDMPRAVFQYFWEVLQAGQPIVAYVKNLSKDGKYYWVLAAAFPIEDGYVSIRLKPSTGIFEKVKQVYANTLKVEQAEGIRRSYPFLLEQVRDLGFASYKDLAREALIREFEARAKKLEETHGAASGPGLSALTVQSPEEELLLRLLSDTAQACGQAASMYETIFARIAETTQRRGALLKENGRIKASYGTIQHLSINMAVAAEKAGAEGRTLTIISETFRKWAVEANLALEKFVSSMDVVSERLDSAAFNVAASRLQVAMIEFYIAETRGKWGGIGDKTSIRASFLPFIQMALSVFTAAVRDVCQLIESVKALKSDLNRLREAMSALYIVRQSGRVEIARFNSSDQSFHQHLQDMGDFINTVIQGVSGIEDSTTAVLSGMSDAGSLLLGVHGKFDALVRRQAHITA